MGKSRGSAIVEYSNLEDALKAKEEYNDAELDN